MDIAGEGDKGVPQDIVVLKLLYSEAPYLEKIQEVIKGKYINTTGLAFAFSKMVLH